MLLITTRYLKKTKKLFKGHYDITFKDFTYNNFTYNINNCDITYMFSFTDKSKVTYK